MHFSVTAKSTGGYDFVSDSVETTFKLGGLNVFHYPSLITILSNQTGSIKYTQHTHAKQETTSGLLKSNLQVHFFPESFYLH
jgi:hypothetical protein